MSTRQRTIGESVTLRGDLDRMAIERQLTHAERKYGALLGERQKIIEALCYATGCKDEQGILGDFGSLAACIEHLGAVRDELMKLSCLYEAPKPPKEERS